MYRMVARKVFPVFLAAAALVCVAGDLNPPPGPVTPTMKPLSHIEPRIPVQSLDGDADALYVIRAPGSYYLIADIVGVPGKSAIKILASNVTLDLNGFVIEGVPDSLHGIYAPGLAPPLTSICVKNGTVSGWGLAGVYLGVYRGIVENIIAGNNGAEGIQANSVCLVRNCVATENGGQAGIVGAGDLRVVDCMSKDNSGHGFYGNSPSVMTGCVATRNGGDGFHLEIGAPSSDKGIVSVTDCTSWWNQGMGINLAASGIVKGCVANMNSGGGIRAADSLVHSSVAVENGSFSIDGDGTSTLVENHAP